MTLAITYPWRMVDQSVIQLTDEAAAMVEQMGRDVICYLIVAGDYWKITFSRLEKDIMRNMMKNQYMADCYKALKVISYA